MEQYLSVTQRHLQTPELLTSLEVLAKPLPELALWLEARIEENPLLSLDSSATEPSLPTREMKTLDLSGIDENHPYHRVSHPSRIIENVAIVEQRDLYTLLTAQARESFFDPEQLQEALDLIHQIDKKGYLPATTKDSFVLTVLQTFDPPGIAARCVQEGLLLQLKRKNPSSIALQILQNHYDDLLQQRMKKLSKHFKISEKNLRALIQRDLTSLSLCPGDLGQKDPTIPWIPDLSIIEEQGRLHVHINYSLLRPISFNRHYIDQVVDEETRAYLSWKSKEARLVIRALRKRSITLRKLGFFLIKTQRSYFLGRSAHLHKVTIQEASSCLGLHGSTISRAIAEKVVNTPRGMQPMGAFFRHGQAIPSSIENKIGQLIQTEDKAKPLSDADISENLCKIGLRCSRRTVAKYRNGMNLPNAHLRRR